jgi:hypothetical protein
MPSIEGLFIRKSDVRAMSEGKYKKSSLKL